MAGHHGEEADRAVQQEEEEERKEGKERLRQEERKEKEVDTNNLLLFFFWGGGWGGSVNIKMWGGYKGRSEISWRAWPPFPWSLDLVPAPWKCTDIHSAGLPAKPIKPIKTYISKWEPLFPPKKPILTYKNLNF